MQRAPVSLRGAHQPMKARHKKFGKAKPLMDEFHVDVYHTKLSRSILQTSFAICLNVSCSIIRLSQTKHIDHGKKALENEDYLLFDIETD